MSCWAVICSYAISAPASEGHMQIRVVLKAQETQPGLLREVVWWVSSSSTSQHEAKFLPGGFLDNASFLCATHAPIHGLPSSLI